MYTLYLTVNNNRGHKTLVTESGNATTSKRGEMNMPASITYPIEFAAPLQAFCAKSGIKARFVTTKRYVRVTRFEPEHSNTIMEAAHLVRTAMTATTTWRLPRKKKTALQNALKRLARKRPSK